MTDRQVKAVAEALEDYLNREMYDNESAAEVAIAASDAQYVKGLVKALKFYESAGMSEFHPVKGRIARAALEHLPEDLRK